MSEWQPIETAPKDGTPIMVLCHAIQPISTAKWDNGLWIGGPYNNSQVDATHWMPYPELPDGWRQWE